MVDNMRQLVGKLKEEERTGEAEGRMMWK